VKIDFEATGLRFWMELPLPDKPAVREAPEA
jgi:hypothetical protein